MFKLDTLFLDRVTINVKLQNRYVEKPENLNLFLVRLVVQNFLISLKEL